MLSLHFLSAQLRASQRKSCLGLGISRGIELIVPPHGIRTEEESNFDSPRLHENWEKTATLSGRL